MLHVKVILSTDFLFIHSKRCIHGGVSGERNKDNQCLLSPTNIEAEKT